MDMIFDNLYDEYLLDSENSSDLDEKYTESFNKEVAGLIFDKPHSKPAIINIGRGQVMMGDLTTLAGIDEEEEENGNCE